MSFGNEKKVKDLQHGVFLAMQEKMPIIMFVAKGAESSQVTDGSNPELLT
jgi:hypothetical protein